MKVGCGTRAGCSARAVGPELVVGQRLELHGCGVRADCESRAGFGAWAGCWWGQNWLWGKDCCEDMQGWL